MKRYPATVMPRKVLFGPVSDMEAWCKSEDKVMPTLLDVAIARGTINRKKRGR